MPKLVVVESTVHVTYSGRGSGTCQLSPSSLVFAAGVLSGFKLSSLGFPLKFPVGVQSDQSNWSPLQKHLASTWQSLILIFSLVLIDCLIILILTTQATEQAVVGSWQGDVSMVVTIKTYSQTKGGLQYYKLST